MASENPKPPRKKKHGDIYPEIGKEGDIPVRMNNLLSLYFPSAEYRVIAKLVNLTGLPASRILAISDKPCEHCKDTPIILMVNNVQVPIPRGLLSSTKKKIKSRSANPKKSK